MFNVYYLKNISPPENMKEDVGKFQYMNYGCKINEIIVEKLVKYFLDNYLLKR